MLNLEKTAHTGIPIYFSEEDFNKFIFPHLLGGRRGPSNKLPLYKLFHYMLYVLYTGVQWRMVPIKEDASGNPEIHYTSIWKKYKQWVQNGSIQQIFYESVRHLNQQGALDLSVLHVDGTNIVAKLGSNHTGYSGHKHQKGNKIVAIVDNEGNIIAPMTIATVNQTGMTLLPNALSDLKTTCTACEIQIPEQTVLNLDAGFDSKKNRKTIWNAKLKPNIKENPRNRKKPKRGRKRFFDKALYDLRFTCERTFAWQDKFRRIILQFEWYREMFLGFNLLAFSLINFRNAHS